MPHHPGRGQLGPESQEIVEAAVAASARSGRRQGPPTVESLRRDLIFTKQELKSARRRIGELQARDALSRRSLAQLQHEVARAHRFAYHDELTGLPNRRLLLDRFDQVVARGSRQHQLVVLLFIDLDRFKQINDAFGHTAGDRVLEQVGARLTGCIRVSDTTCRYGGDEFVVMLPEIQSQEHAVSITEKLRARLAAPYAIGHSTIKVPASIGMAVCPIDGCELDELIQAADRDMYRDKARGDDSAVRSAVRGRHQTAVR